MKRIQQYAIAMLVALTIFSVTAMGQETVGKEHAPGIRAKQDRMDWIPDNGYWEVITKDSQPQTAIVRFYDLQRHLIHEEQVTGVVLDLHRRSTCRRLNRSLQIALAAW